MSRTGFLTVLILLGLAQLATAAQVTLDIATEERVPLTAQQEWSRRLGQAGLSNVRFHARQTSDRPEVRNLGSAAAPMYQVIAVLTPDETLLVPGRRFRAGDVVQLKQWLAEISEQGPEDRRPPKTAFGLDVQQFEKIDNDLGQMVGFPTAGVSRHEVIRKITGQLTLPTRSMPAKLPTDDKVAEELGGLSCGTALACVLRPMGLCLVPQVLAGNPGYAIMPSKPGLEIWPIGWPPDKPEPKLLPQMFEFLNINVQGVPVTKVIDAVSARVKVPVLIDHNALARHGVEPEKAIVKLPQGKTTYSLLLRKALFQAQLKSEVRVDEGDHVLIWVTTLKPI